MLSFILYQGRTWKYCNTRAWVSLFLRTFPGLFMFEILLLKDINLLHNTQIFVLQVCTENWSIPSSILHSQLSLPSLADRRLDAKLCHLFSRLSIKLRISPTHVFPPNLCIMSLDILTLDLLVLFILIHLSFIILILSLFGTLLILLSIHPHFTFSNLL